MYTAQDLSYKKACELMMDLRNSGIECGETTGGVALYITYDQVPLAKSICEKHGANLVGGYSRVQTEFLAKQGDIEEVSKMRRDSEAVLKEWM